MFTITFRFETGSPVTIDANPGEKLLDVARKANVAIDAPCSGNGVCGKCRVRLASGSLDAPINRHITQEEYDAGWRLACLATVTGDAEIEVPDIASAYRSRMKMADLSSPEEIAIFEDLRKQLEDAGVAFGSDLAFLSLELDEPTLDDTMPDNERLLRAVEASTGVDERDIMLPYAVLKNLSEVLRESNFKVKCVISRDGSRILMRDVLPGDSTDPLVGFALDVGTTSLAGVLVDLESGKILAKASGGNGQIRYGADVINRIIESGKPGGRKRLQDAVIKESIIPMLSFMYREAGIDPRLTVHEGEHGDDGLLDDRVLEALASAGFAGLDDAVDDVGSVADLPVAAAGLGQDLSALQVYQHARQGGGAHVQREAHQGIGAVPGEHVPHEDAAAVTGNDALDLEIALPQYLAQVFQHRVGQHDVALVYAGGGLHRPEEPLVVGHGVVQRGLVQLQGQEGQVAAKGHARVLQLLAEVLKNGDLLRGAEVGHLHPGAVSGGDVGYLDLRVAGDGGQAGQPPAGIVLLLGDVAVDGGVQAAGGQPDPAFAAHAVAGTGGVDGHVGLPGHVQELFAGVGVDGHRGTGFETEGNGKHRNNSPFSGFRLCWNILYRSGGGLSRI